MQAVILCGGRATRLAERYADRPKALVPVAGRPFLERQLAWLARGGVRSVHLAAGYQAQLLADWVRSHAEAGAAGSSVEHRVSSVGSQVSGFQFQVSGVSLSLSLSTETAPLGTGGGLKFTEPFLQTDPVLVLNGDSLVPRLDFQGLEAAHRRFSNAWTTLAVTRTEESGRYGTVEFDDRGQVTAFREKAQHRAGWVNGGVYVVSRAAFPRIPADRTVSLETDLFPYLAAQGRVTAFPTEPPLLDMGTPDGLKQMEQYLQDESGGKHSAGSHR